jgi:pimeloyl-ACP methyl ester carboxylesterase
MLEQNPEQAVDTICQWAFSAHTRKKMKDLAAQQILATPVKVLRDDFQACDAFDIREHLSDIASPTLVLCGRQDRMTPLEYSIDLRDSISGATMTIVNGAGHMVMLERPKAVQEAVTYFLNSL